MRQRISDINSYFLMLLGISIPLTITGSTFIYGLIIILWLIEADFKRKFEEIKDNKFVWASVLFFLIHIIGLLWTEDLEWGLHIIIKESKFLLIPIFMTVIKKKHLNNYIWAFVLAMIFSCVVSYLIWFDIISPFKRNASAYNPTSFIGHITYNPFLAFAVYLLLYKILFETGIEKERKTIYSVLVIALSINMFITGGRAGHIAYFVMLFLILFQYFKFSWKTVLISIISLSMIFIMAYKGSNIFKERVESAISDIKNFEPNAITSVGERINFVLNSLKIIQSSPIIGMGTGDFPKEYAKIIAKNSHQYTTNPHNMYILVISQFGLIGFIIFLSLFYFQFKHSFYNTNSLRYIQQALPIMFLVIMFSDSYLLGHATTMMFIYFSSFLYKNYEI